MSAAPADPLDGETERNVAGLLGERLVRPVGFDVWTRQESALIPVRDACAHGDETLAMMRQLVRLHPALTVTPYDLDRHAGRAAEAGVDMAPTTIVRSGGRSLYLVGMCAGLLFAAMLDAIGYLSSGDTPLEPESVEALEALTLVRAGAPVHLDLTVVPYSPYSSHMLRLVAAFAAVSRLVRVRVIEASQFPLFAQRRGITEVPLLTIEGKHFVGVWEEEPLLEQIQRVLAGDDMPVLREHVYSAPFIAEEDVRRLAADEPPETTESGLYVPGRG